ncbi:CLI_3235 family bacteriocin precursor [Paenibacillus sp. CAA11]|uniref:CLI_3235 family bacteriocin precursor n=1 Tax=Paenibacillus sp. CAA11 TaxID=1532905 RepID=UPI003FA396A3
MNGNHREGGRLMKKLGKKINSTQGTLMAYACSCGTCPCATSKCTCRTNSSATHRNALTTASSSTFNMQYAGLQIGS